MNRDQVISDELFEKAQIEIGKGNNWIAVDRNLYFLGKDDMRFFGSSRDAHEHIAFYNSEDDDFRVFHAYSAEDILKQIPYGNMVRLPMSEAAIEEMFRQFDWSEAFYDPLHDLIESDTDRDKEELARMEALLNEWDALYERDPEAALKLACTYWEGRPMENYKNDFLTIKFDLMIEKNLDYLKSNVRNHGFGETLGPELEEKLKSGAAEFTLPYKTEVNKQEMEATLYFKKSDTTDMYFFNKYDTRLKSERDEVMAQTFYINSGWGVTLKEAYNLLNGRAVHKELTPKEGEKYQAWIQLDFSAKDKNGNYERKQYHENYGYNLKETLSSYPIKEMMKEGEAKDLVRSLERGNVQMVTLETKGKDIKVFIEANPKYKSIIIYDNKMKRLDQDKREELITKLEMNEGKDKTKDQKQGLAPEGQDGKKSGKVKKNEKVNGEDNGLVKKTRTRNPGKGLSV